MMMMMMITLLLQVAGERSPDVLVILGAQHSGRKRYREALYCLDRALQLDPGHVRGHYSRGQVRLSQLGRYLIFSYRVLHLRR